MNKNLFLTSREGRGITPEQLKESQQEHLKKLEHWKVLHIYL